MVSDESRHTKTYLRGATTVKMGTDRAEDKREASLLTIWDRLRAGLLLRPEADGAEAVSLTWAGSTTGPTGLR